MGIRVSGKLGSGSDIKQAYIIFEKNTIIPLRNIIEDIVNDLLKIADVKADFTINNFQIVNETIVELDENTSAVNDALNTMNPELEKKVIETMTVNEIRAMVGLPAIQEPTRPWRAARDTRPNRPNPPKRLSPPRWNPHSQPQNPRRTTRAASSSSDRTSS